MDMAAPRSIKTTCPYCGVGCGVIADISAEGVSVRGDPELQGDLYKLGARFIIAGNDTGYLLAAGRKDVETLRTLST